MVGMHGMYESNWAMHDCDLMINIGARFDDRVTGKVAAFAPNSKKIHIDIDPSSINKNVRVDLPIVGDVAHVLEDLIKVWKAKQARPNVKALDAWWKQIEAWRGRDCLHYKNSDSIIKPQFACSGCSRRSRTRTSTSRPRSASTRCGPPSSSSSKSRTAG